jgi:REP element-mobilizing transposase RayT
MKKTTTRYPAFFTATNLEWKYLLKRDKYKDIILSSLKFLVQKNRIELNAFVIMSNHLHLIWQIKGVNDPSSVQRDFLKYTAQRIQKDMALNHPDELTLFKVKARDRAYQFWERNPLSIELRTEYFFRQKLNYIHQNPVRAGICQIPEDYCYSSAAFYRSSVDRWGFLTYRSR